ARSPTLTLWLKSRPSPSCLARTLTTPDAWRTAGSLIVRRCVMRFAVAAAGAALVLIAVGACGGSGGGSSAPATLVVGEFNPFTGPDAAFGPEMVGGCLPAVRLINSSGGVLGHKVRCVREDTLGDPADAVPAAQKMMATETSLIGVLGPSSDEAL